MLIVSGLRWSVLDPWASNVSCSSEHQTVAEKRTYVFVCTTYGIGGEVDKMCEGKTGD